MADIVTASAQHLYKLLAESGGSAPREALLNSDAFTEADIDALVLLHLVSAEPATGTVSVLNPRLALTASVAQRSAEISRLHTESEQVRQEIEELQYSYDSMGRPDDQLHAVDRTDDVRLIRSLLAHAADSCVSEVLSSQPEALLHERTVVESPHNLELLQRGVRIRTIYPHTALSSPTAQRLFSTMQAAGSEIRTASGVIEHVIVFDREVAFLADRRDSNGGAVIIREPAIVDYLYQSLEQAWCQAAPFAYTGVGYGDTIDDLKSGILRVMAVGAKDEVVAKHMNMSTRTCRRHISEILAELGAGSRFQAGMLASALGLIEACPGPRAARRVS